MSSEEEKGQIRRILVALDASPHSLAALRTAAALAAQLGAELQGLYIEDVTILRLAALPVSRRVTVFTLEPERSDRERLELELRAQARQARRALAEIASRSRLRWSFRVVQGTISQELLRAAQDADLLLLGKAGWSRRRRLGSTALVMMREAPVGVMLIQHGGRLSMPVSLVYNGSEAAQRAMRAAAILLPPGQDFLNIFVLAENAEQARARQIQAAAWLRTHGLQARFRWLVNSSTEEMLGMFQTEGCGVLVMPAQESILPEQALAELVNAMGCPVLLVR